MLRKLDGFKDIKIVTDDGDVLASRYFTEHEWQLAVLCIDEERIYINIISLEKERNALTVSRQLMVGSLWEGIYRAGAQNCATF